MATAKLRPRVAGPAVPLPPPPGATAPESSPAALPTPAQASRTQGRIQFLDGLRGIAALAVALQHGSEQIWPGYLRWSETVFRPGEWGVILFFLISGFIIPASLERYGSLGRFWISRFFRLFPMYWATMLAIAFFAFVVGTFHLPQDVSAQPGRAFAVNATMMTNFITPPPILGQSWSLAYELTFYGMVSAFFLCGLHRRSVRLAIGWLVAALAVGVTAPVLGFFYQHGFHIPGFISGWSAATAFPGSWLQHLTAMNVAQTAIVVVALVAIVAVAARLSRGRALVLLLLTVIFLPLFLNRPEPLYFAVLLFTSMFVGTVQYRYVRGVVSGRVALAVFLAGILVTNFVLRAEIQPHVIPVIGGVANWRTEGLTFTAAYLVFGAGLLLRHRNVPRWLLWLGAISYSLYLVHVVVYYDTPWWGNSGVLTLLRWLAISLAVSSVTYLVIERPFQNFGHALAKRGLPRTRVAAAA